MSSKRSGRVRVLLTRNGLHFLSIAVFCVLGSVIRELNLLVILAGLLFGLLVLQWRFCRRTLDRLEVGRTLPREIFANRSFKVVLTVHNSRRLMPAWLLRITDVVGPVQRTSRRVRGQVLLHHVPPGQTRSGSYEAMVDRRGEYRCNGLEVRTDFPFGLATGRVRIESPENFLVYPAIGTLRQGWRRIIEARYAGLSSNRRRAGQTEGDFFGLRPWQNGDSRRWIHWRTTARLGELAVRQFEHQRRDEVILIVDLYEPPTPKSFGWTQPNGGNRTYQRDVERALQIGATIAEMLTRSASTRIAFGLTSSEPTVVASKLVAEIRKESLDALALARSTDVSGDQLLTMMRQLSDGPRRHWPPVVISTRQLPPDECRDFVAKKSVVWIDVTNPDIRSFIQLDDMPERVPSEPAHAAS